MIKRLIFDVDGTLMEWKNEYWEALEEVFNQLKIEYNETIKNNIIKAIDTYEETNQYYSKQKILEHINKVAKCNFDIKFLNAVLERFDKCVPVKDEKVISTLEYLSKKYELVVLTNWLKGAQENRLRNFGILDFFSNVFASETFKIKPNKESFIVAIENRKQDECIMIGDSLRNDIQGAINAGIKAIYLNPKANKEEKEDYIIINDITELKNIL